MKQNDETQSRWYMVNKDGMCTLCADQADAEQEAKDSQELWPHMGPHRAVQLRESSGAWFTAADMATASAQGFRDGQAAELAAMRAGGAPVGYYYKFRNAFGYEVWSTNAPRNGQSALEVQPLYTHPKPAAQDAERRPLTDGQIDQAIAELGLNYLVAAHATNRSVLRKLCHQAHAIAAQQGDRHE